MNKLVMMVVLAAAAAFARAEVYTLAQMEADYNRLCDVAQTNAAAAQAMLSDGGDVLAFKSMVGLEYRGDAEVVALAAEADEVLSGLGLRCFWSHYTDPGCPCPKLCKAGFDYIDAGSVLSNCVALGEKYGVNCSPGYLARSSVLTNISDLVMLLGDSVPSSSANIKKYDKRLVETLLGRIQRAGLKVVKKQLRSQGLSFATVNGVNPCEGPMTELNAALDAPRFAGLNEWLVKMGQEPTLDTSRWPTAEEVADMRGKVLNADVEMTPRRALILRLCLGVEGYNAFVAEYNGER